MIKLTDNVYVERISSDIDLINELIKIYWVDGRGKEHLSGQSPEAFEGCIYKVTENSIPCISILFEPLYQSKYESKKVLVYTLVNKEEKPKRHSYWSPYDFNITTMPVSEGEDSHTLLVDPSKSIYHFIDLYYCIDNSSPLSEYLSMVSEVLSYIKEYSPN